jgi:hypothetical protein
MSMPSPCMAANLWPWDDAGMSTPMSSRERLETVLRGGQPDHLPFAPFLAYFWEAQPRAVRERGQLAFLQDIGADPLWRCSPSVVSWTCSGLEIREVRRGHELLVSYETPVGTLHERLKTSEHGDSEYLVDHMIHDVEDYKTLRWIEEHTVLHVDEARARAHLSANGREGVSLACPIHERSGRLRKTAFQCLIEHYVGTEQLVYDLYDDPAVVEETLEVMTARNLEAVRLSGASDVYQWFLTFEDSSTQNYSPTMYADYIAPEIRAWAEALAATEKQYVQHACGHLRDLLGSIQTQGIWGIESLSPPTTGNIAAADVRATLGPDFGIIGAIEPVTLESMPIEELEPYLDSVLAGAAGGRFVLANADSCPPGVTPDKLRFVADWARRQVAGTYPT